jgi:1-acyl-sn-glycerol-3-phosphate acyltransferase
LEGLRFDNGIYKTAPRSLSFLSKTLPSVSYYLRLLSIVFRASSKAKHSRYNTEDWANSSLEVLRALEHVGITFEITGIDNFREIPEPCVFLSNHMSTLETFVLPGIIAPLRDVTFVVKKSLIDYPVFKYVMRSRDPITVGRTNPRDDLRAVLDGGPERLKAGRSIIIFPQTTRHLVFDPTKFNTIGVKLAKRANAPIIPIALKTDAWGNGTYLKDFGKIDPSKKVHFAFGKPMWVKDRGTEEHEAVISYISTKLKEWQE